MDNFVEVRNLLKVFPGGTRAVDNISFIVKKGQLLSLLGPSGCGKTTTLRCIAGLEKPDSGEILVGGEVYYSAEKGILIPPDKRNLGMVFQSYAVWPHMNVFDNIAYGLKMHNVKKTEIGNRVADVIELVGLQGLSYRQVTKLSGGQQQRVALARALVYNPKLLLFDEPLSNLDAKLRDRMRLELKNLLQEIGVTSVFVTHDQAEAMTMSDEIIVMQEGKIAQIGDAKSIYHRPKNKYVADFIGIANFLEGEIIHQKYMGADYGICKVSDGVMSCELRSIVSEDIREKEDVALFFRPENVMITKSAQENDINTFAGRIESLIYLGNFIDCRIKIGLKEIKAQISCEEDLQVGDEVSIKIAPEHCVCVKI
jgi:iron(III) transport system ATP-binding protein